MQNTEAATGPHRGGPHIAKPSPSWSPDASMFLGRRLSVGGSNVAVGSHLIVDGILGSLAFLCSNLMTLEWDQKVAKLSVLWNEIYSSHRKVEKLRNQHCWSTDGTTCL